jgi:spore maturation protein CgeB
VFETLACGVPLLSSHWPDVEKLFNVGTDFLMAESGDEMKHLLRWMTTHPDAARQIASSGLQTVRSRHTCAHRVDELIEICAQVSGVNTCKLLSLDPA